MININDAAIWCTSTPFDDIVNLRQAVWDACPPSYWSREDAASVLSRKINIKQELKDVDVVEFEKILNGG